MMSAGQHGILRARLANQSSPSSSVKVFGGKLFRELRVIVRMNILPPLGPFTVTKNGITAPVNKNTKSRLLKPAHALDRIWRGSLVGRGSHHPNLVRLICIALSQQM